MALAAEKQVYRATFERTDKKNVEGKSQVVTLSTEDPNHPELQRLVDNGKFGYLRITDASGKKVSGLQVSALKAREVMNACLSGKHNPFPKIRNKRRELGAE